MSLFYEIFLVSHLIFQFIKENGFYCKNIEDITETLAIANNEVNGKDLNKHIKITLGDFKDFQAKHDLDDANLLDMIAPVATMASKK